MSGMFFMCFAFGLYFRVWPSYKNLQKLKNLKNTLKTLKTLKTFSKNLGFSSHANKRTHHIQQDPRPSNFHTGSSRHKTNEEEHNAVSATHPRMALILEDTRESLIRQTNISFFLHI